MKFLSLLQDDTGALSSQRAAFLGIIGTFIGLWVMQSISEKKVAAVDPTVLALIFGMLTGKVTQSITENSGNKDTVINVNNNQTK